MVRRVATRSQRRTEKKQAVVLLALVLIVALVSFVFGMMIGRSSSTPVVAAVAPQPARLPVAPPVPASTPADVSAAIAEHPAENLTFYDSLPKGGQTPLGSGINLPPAKAPAPAPVTAVADSGEAARPVAEDHGTTETKGTDRPVAGSPTPVKTATTPAPVPAATPAPAPATKAVSAVTPPPAVAAGGYLVQAAAFRRSEDARALQAKLGQKGYSAFTEAANLGEKGIWYRVYVGPFATTSAADAAVARLKAEEKLTALVRKR